MKNKPWGVGVGLGVVSAGRHTSCSHSVLHAKGKSLLIFLMPALKSLRRTDTCRKGNPVAPLRGILFFMIWFGLFCSSFFSYSPTSSYIFFMSLYCRPSLQMKSKMLLIVYWITENAAPHPIQCEIMLTTWLNSSAKHPVGPDSTPSPSPNPLYVHLQRSCLCIINVSNLIISKETALAIIVLSTCAPRLTLIDCISIQLRAVIVCTSLCVFSYA